FSKFSRVSRTVALRGDRRQIRAQGGTSEFSINGVRFFCDFPLLANADANLISTVDVAKIIEPILRPSKIKGASKIETVVLDPGHGGTDNGAAGLRGSEKTYARDVALTAREELLRAGFKVEMTRSGDQTVSLQQRVAFANRFAHALFISIHFNSAPGGAGVECYALAPAGVPSNAASENHADAGDTTWYPGNAQDAANMALTAAVHGAILSRVSVFDRGVRHARFYVLRDCKIPGVLVEAGFLSARNEGALIATAPYRQKLGRAIAQAVESYNAAVTFRAGPALVATAKNLPPHTHSITEPLGTATAPKPSAPAQSPSVIIGGSN
ncbi:MAG: N-acetylmuramoyl-L-alanine amidase family protein, partial [Bryobacteraceae bacterium]